MRRLERTETLHGTRNGQLAVDADLLSTFALTEREGAVASLLSKGQAPGEISEFLAISRSAVDKHLSSLRRKLGVETTYQAVARLAALGAQQGAAIPNWPVAPSHDARLHRGGVDFTLAESLRSVGALEQALGLLLDHLEPEHVGTVFYVFLSRNVASLRRNSLIECSSGNSNVADAYRESGGLSVQPITHRILAEPDRDILIDLRNDEIVGPPLVWDSALKAGFAFNLSFGVPVGCGFVGASMLLREAARESLARDRAERVARFRSALHTMHSAAYSSGLLARRIGLTQRERDSLSHLAEGKSVAETAVQLGAGERGLSRVLASAREKLGAHNNADAISEAMSLNALVFL